MQISATGHWNNVYATKAEDEVSWFQPYPTTSMEFVEQLNLPLDAAIIDVGGGDSRFADALLDKGYQNIWVLDISAAAIEKAKKRLGPKASNVHWVVSDVTAFNPPVQFALWHDRAAFHFLTTDEEIHKYVAIAESAIHKNGCLVLATFSEQGPRKCSGLDIKQYSEASMSARFATNFQKIKCLGANHTTPAGSVQHFQYCSFKRI